MFFHFFLDSNEKTLYLCNVFFIVLDLRLTKVRVAAATHFFCPYINTRFMLDNGIFLASSQPKSIVSHFRNEYLSDSIANVQHFSEMRTFYSNLVTFSSLKQKRRFQSFLTSVKPMLSTASFTALSSMSSPITVATPL